VGGAGQNYRTAAASRMRTGSP